MNKKWQGRVDSAYKWMKIGGVSILVITGAYAFGTFKPNTLAVDRITKSVEQTQVEWAKNLGLHEPSFEYKNNVQFVKALNKCIDYLNFTTPLEKRVPIEMITAQAALESAWGMSRFAKEANNLFGIKTWNKDMGILPAPMFFRIACKFVPVPDSKHTALIRESSARVINLTLLLFFL